MRRALLALLLIVALSARAFAFSASFAVKPNYVRGSDWGGGVGGIIYSLPGDGNTSLAKYYHYDGRGDVVAQLAANGTIAYQAAYDAYGTHAGNVSAGTEQSGSRAGSFGFGTKEEDPGTGFVNINFRPYDPETGTFLTRDPAGFVDGPNLYTYVRQNPYTFFDPEGLKTKKDYEGEISAANDAYDNQMNNANYYHNLDKSDPNRMSDQDFAKKQTEITERRDAKIANAKRGISNIQETAKLAREKGISNVTENTLDDRYDPRAQAWGGGEESDVFYGGNPSVRNGGADEYLYIQRQIGKQIAEDVAAMAVTEGGMKVVGEGVEALRGAKAASKIDRAAFRAEREAFWKAEAKNNPGKYKPEDLAKMKQGRAPTGSDGYPVELHHVDQTPEGGVTPMTRTDHRLGENYKLNHPD